MKKILTALIVLALASLACSITTGLSANQQALMTLPTASSTASSTALSPTAPAARIVCAEHLNLRAEAGVNAAIVAVLTADTAVTPTGETIERDGSAWAKVTVGGLAGWLNAQYLCQ